MKHNLLKRVLFLFVCFGLTTLISAQTVYPVEAGDNAIGDAILLNAEPGDVIELTTSGGIYTDSVTIDITFDITIRAAAGLAEKPVIVGGDKNVFILVTGGLTVEGIKFEGGNYVIRSGALDAVTSSDFSIKIDNCEFHNFAQRAVYTSDGVLTPLDSVICTNSIFKDGYKQGFYLKTTKGADGGIYPGGFKYFKLENSLFLGLTANGDGYPVYAQPSDKNDGSQGWPEVFIDHCTADSCFGGFYALNMPGSLIQNCIVSNMFGDGRYAFNIEPGRWDGSEASTLKNCIYNGGGLNVDYGAAIGIVENVDSVQAQYTNAAMGDYSLLAGTAGTGAATDGEDIGYIGPAVSMPATLPDIWEPGFEADTVLTGVDANGNLIWDTWYENTNEINTDAAYVHSGTKSLKITAKGGRSQYVTGFTPGSTVSLLAWGKSDGLFTNLSHQPKMGIACYNEAGDRILEAEGSNKDEAGENYIVTINPDGWSREVVSATIPEEAVEMKVYVWCSWDTGDPISYIDDFEMKFGDSTVIDHTIVEPVEYNSNDVKVYPNPTMGQLYISIGDDVAGVSSLKIIDITGKVVSRLDNLNGRRQVDIDLSSAPAGLYFGMLTSESKTHSFKILKK